LKFTSILSAGSIRSNINDIPTSSGVYKHFVDPAGLSLLSDVKPTQQEITDDGKRLFLLYIGLAKNLRYRFKWHLGLVNVSNSCIVHGTLSTLRLSYMSNHKDITSLSEQDRLNEFMDKHIHMSYLESINYKEVEQELINSNDLPLNIKGNNHPFVKINKERRKQMKLNYKS